VVIETYGSGNLPKDRPKILEIMKEANSRGVLIVNVSQCRKGIASNYETGALLESIGVVYAGDMTVECCLAKLSYLLGKVNDYINIK
jgi:lysophospholipase